MSSPVSSAERSRFYEAALLGLRALDEAERTGRRFGADADARWNGFRGHLGMAERLDLVIRDAAVKWASAFSPALVFKLPGLAADEPFGPDWSALPEHEAARLWAEDSRSVCIQTAAQTLGVEATPMVLPAISPPTRLLVAGGAAIANLALHFQQHSDLSWSDQVLVVAEQAGLRQLAGLMAPLLYAAGPTRLVLPPRGLSAALLLDDVAAVLKKVGFSPGATPVTSDDASDDCLSFVNRAARRG